MIREIASMLTRHWFWGVLVLACLVWYASITVYVAVKGFKDIRTMLRRLSSAKDPGPKP